jgi:hypothetical protein
MASHWVKLTHHVGDKQIALNLANAIRIERSSGGGTKITFVNGYDYNVTEDFEAVYKLAGQGNSDERQAQG